MILDYVPHDGYTERAHIKAIPGVHGDFRFKFRPMLREKREPLAAYMQKPDKNVSTLVKMVEEALVEHVKEWSLVDDKGQAVPVSIDAVHRLKPVLANRIEDIVMGYSVSDTIDEDGGLTPTQLLEAEITGKPPGDVRTEADLKN